MTHTHKNILELGLIRVIMNKIIAMFLLLSLAFQQSFAAGFCDNQGGKQTVSNIHVFGTRAYVSISPGFVGGGIADSCKKNEVALDLTDNNLKFYYPLLITALTTGKQVNVSYCGTCVSWLPWTVGSGAIDSGANYL